jgi:hypothetical protein
MVRRLIVLLFILLTFTFAHGADVDVDVNSNDKVDIAFGGTDSGTAAAARTALGLAIGTNVQAYDADLTTYAGITPAANTQALLAAADYAAMKALLNLEIGTDVQAYDADLTTYAGITPSANVQSLLAAADYAAMRTLLDLEAGTDFNAYDADLATYAGITPSANVQSLLAAADYAAMKVLLDLEIGTDLQAWSAILDTVTASTYAGDNAITILGTIATGVWQGTAIAALYIGTDLTPANFGAAQTYAEGDLIDLSAITMSVGVDEGIALPTYADVAPGVEKYYMAYDAAGNRIMVREAGGWVDTSAGTGAPTTAHYVVTAAHAALSDESVLTEGTAIDVADAGGDGGAVTVSWDSTEVEATTWGAGGNASNIWTFNLSGTDHTMTFASGLVTFSHAVTVTGALSGALTGNALLPSWSRCFRRS